MAIKLKLAELVELFGESAGNTELPESVRRLAARLTVLTGHVTRIEMGLVAKQRALEAQIAELAQLTAVIAEQRKPAATPAPEAAPESAGEGPSLEDEEAAAQEMAETVLRETEAEARALAEGKAKPEAAIVPMRPNNNKKPPSEPSTGEAS